MAERFYRYQGLVFYLHNRFNQMCDVFEYIIFLPYSRLMNGGYYEAVEKAEAKINDNMVFTKSEPEQTPETLENKSVSSISDTPETLTYKSIKHNYLYYIVPTSYNHSIIKALLQNVIYYSRESSRRRCPKNTIKKALLKVLEALKKFKLCAIIIIYNTNI